MTRNAQFKGVFCPSITITNADGTIDYDNWGKHLDHLIDAGIDGVLLFGSIGEFYAIDVKTKAEAVRFAVSKVAGRMKVLVGVGDTNLDNVRTLAAESEAAGADALVAVSPYYFGPSPDCAKRYFSAVAKATTLPVILYNFPARTGNDLTPELVADLAAENQNIIGIKDTVDTISHTRKVIAAVRKVNPSFSVLSGFDEYYTAATRIIKEATLQEKDEQIYEPFGTARIRYSTPAGGSESMKRQLDFARALAGETFQMGDANVHVGASA